MTVNPVNGNAQVHAPLPVVHAPTAAGPIKPRSPIPTDTVTISAAPKPQQTSSSGDVDHDNDSK